MRYFFQNDKQHEAGNIFFFILLAIALFAALSYAVSSNRGGSTNIFTEEQAKLAAQEVIDYGTTIANAVQKLRLRGCSDTQISFENSAVSGYANGINTSCQVFHTNGGNINFPTFGETLYDANAPTLPEISFNAENNINDISSGEAELVAFVSRLKQDICDEINLSLNDTTSFSGSAFSVDGAADNFTGTYSSSPDTICSGDADRTTSGCCLETTDCTGGSNTCYHFYQVLLAR